MIASIIELKCYRNIWKDIKKSVRLFYCELTYIQRFMIMINISNYSGYKLCLLYNWFIVHTIKLNKQYYLRKIFLSLEGKNL